MAEVLVARIAPCGARRSRSANRAALRSTSSMMASTMMSDRAAPSRSVVPVMRASAASASPVLIAPFSANLANEASIAPRPLTTASREMSRRITSWPAIALTCAMPEPMSPAPTTMTVDIRPPQDGDSPDPIARGYCSVTSGGPPWIAHTAPDPPPAALPVHASCPHPDRSTFARPIPGAGPDLRAGLVRDPDQSRAGAAPGQSSNGLGMSSRSIWAPMPTRLGTNPAYPRSTWWISYTVV